MPEATRSTNNFAALALMLAESRSTCIVWSGGRTPDGYGIASTRFRSGQTRRAHRIAYEAHRGQIPAGLVTDHLCRDRACVNPWHLELVTPAENTLRGLAPSAQNARKTHCPYGHEYVYSEARKARVCRPCKAAGERARRARLKASA